MSQVGYKMAFILMSTTNIERSARKPYQTRRRWCIDPCSLTSIYLDHHKEVYYVAFCLHLEMSYRHLVFAIAQTQFFYLEQSDLLDVGDPAVIRNLT